MSKFLGVFKSHGFTVFWAVLTVFLLTSTLHQSVMLHDLIQAQNRMTAATLDLTHESRLAADALSEMMDLMNCGEWEDHE